MAEQVKVTSIDALQSLRSSLIVFLTSAHRSVDEVLDEVRRVRVWLQNDQRMHWEGQVRKWRKTLDQAQQELMSARLSGLRDSTTAQQNAVLKAKRALAEAEDKLRAVKRWNRDYDSHADPLTKRLESFRHVLDHDMPKGLSYLLQAQKTLEAYAETQGVDGAPIRPDRSEEAPHLTTENP
ncbi:MAG TPA: hypothetical protein VGO90_04915 [Chthoniobacteraceae bacterium]|jgi:alkylhydroperoxidase family enzyme|nr:hypothetical protein [Chthoniobacteraceae bacterium]